MEMKLIPREQLSLLPTIRRLVDDEVIGIVWPHGKLRLRYLTDDELIYDERYAVEVSIPIGTNKIVVLRESEEKRGLCYTGTLSGPWDKAVADLCEAVGALSQNVLDVTAAKQKMLQEAEQDWLLKFARSLFE